jgi:hypothetical protein
MAADFRPSRRRRRAAWASGLSLILHALALTGMVVGLKVAKPPPEDRAIELQLIPPPQLQRTPKPVAQAPERAEAAPILKPHLPPQIAPSAPVAALPEAPTPAPAAPKRDYGPKEVGPDDYALSGKMGCDDPLGMKLTPAQRLVCAGKLGRLAKDAKPLDNIPESKRREYDAVARHQEACRQREVPLLNPDTNPNATRNPNPSSINPYYGAGTGMAPSGGGFCP